MENALAASLELYQSILASGFVVYCPEQVVVPTNSGSPETKVLSVLMMLEQNGQERTLEEYESLLARAGFALCEVILTPSPHSIFIAKVLDR